MNLLKELLLKTQEELKSYLFEKMKALGYSVLSKDGYLKCEYKNGHQSLLISHLDTYSDIIPQHITIENNIIVGYNKDNNRCILGGDDRCGVYIILHLIENGYRPQVLFTEDEEKGCRGAYEFTKNEEQFSEKINYCIEIDRGIKNNPNNYVDYRVSNNQFNEYIESFGFKKMRGISSDVRVIAPYLKVPGVNVCAGYENEHSADEYIDVNVVENTFDKLLTLYSHKAVTLKKKRNYQKKFE
jgi:di/tripeptidase